MAFPKKPNKKTSQPPPQTIINSNDDVTERAVPEAVAEALTNDVDDGSSVSGGEETVIMSKATLEALVADAVAKQLALRTIEAKHNNEPAPAAGLNEMVRDAVSLAIRETVPAAMMVMNQMNGSDHQRHMASIKARLAKETKCEVCGQSITGCGGPWMHGKVGDVVIIKPRDDRGRVIQENVYTFTITKVDKEGYAVDEDNRRILEPNLNHYKMNVFPRNEENVEWFAGLKINGVVYCSNGPGHDVWVPNINNFAAILSDFEVGEKRTRTPRKIMASQGNGVVSGNGGTRRPTWQFS